MITQKDKTYIFLSSLDISYKKFSDILSLFDDVKNILPAIENDNSLIVNEFGSNFNKIKEKYDNFSFETFEKYLTTKSVSYLIIDNENYPKKLLELDQPPFILYCKGDIKLLQTECFGIVGTRNPSFYGKDITSTFAKGLCKEFTIVSGLATGVDKIAHETTLKEQQKTIAVLGNGFEHMYPAMNINLASQIVESGLLITEYYPTFQATSYSFPARNRIIAGLCKGILITEAGQKSGALITKDFMIELGRDVFCVPGNITSPRSYGTNNSIKFGHCACVTSVEDIMSNYGIKSKKTKKDKIQLSFEEQNIYTILCDGEQSLDELLVRTKMTIQELNTYLLTLQINGIVKKLPGNIYSI